VLLLLRCTLRLRRGHLVSVIFFAVIMWSGQVKYGQAYSAGRGIWANGEETHTSGQRERGVATTGPVPLQHIIQPTQIFKFTVGR